MCCHSIRNQTNTGGKLRLEEIKTKEQNELIIAETPCAYVHPKSMSRNSGLQCGSVVEALIGDFVEVEQNGSPL